MNMKFIPLALCLGLLGLAPIQAQETNPPSLPEQAETAEQAQPSPGSDRSGESESSGISKGDLIAICKDAVLQKGEGAGDVITVFGDATINGTVHGGIVVVAGKLYLNSKVEGDVIVVGGSAEFGPETRSTSDVIIVGGTLKRDPGARIKTNPIEVAPMVGPFFLSALTWIKSGLLLGRPVVPSLPWVWGVVGAFFVLYCLLAILFRRSLATGVETLDTRPIGSFFAGFLFCIVLIPLFGCLVLSGVGLILLPFLLCPLLILVLIGKIVVYQTLGSLVYKQLRPPGYGSIIGLALGMAVCVSLGMIPFIGMFVWGFTAVIGVGAVILSCFRLLVHEPPATNITFTAPPSGPDASAAQSGVASTLQTPPPPFLSSKTYPLAGFWIRAGALLLDVILVAGCLALVHSIRLLPLGLFIYYVGLLAVKGATIGDMITGLKCMRTNGQPLNWSLAIVRSLASVLSAMPFGLGFFWAGWDSRKETWHDKVAGTIMVRAPQGY